MYSKTTAYKCGEAFQTMDHCIGMSATDRRMQRSGPNSGERPSDGVRTMLAT